MRVSIHLFLLKSSLLPLFFALLPRPYALVLSILAIAIYRQVIGFFLGLKPMPGMDMATFLGITT